MENKINMARSINIPSYKTSSVMRIVFYSAFLMVFYGGMSVSAQDIATVTVVPIEEGQDSIAVDSYLIEKIAVDITADNAVEAREQAFEAAQIKGFEALAKRLLTADEFKEFETPDINVISSYVQDYEVTNEKLSAVRYNGTYQIRFRKSALSKMRKIVGTIEAVETKKIAQQGHLLVLPIYQRGGRTFLWQANPFMQAWVRARDNGQAQQFIVPVGDIDDIKQVRDGQGLSYDPSRLNAMRIRYNADHVMIMTVEPSTAARGSKAYNLKVYDAQAYGPELKIEHSMRAYSGELEDQLYNRLVGEALRLTENMKPQAQQAGFNQQEVRANYNEVEAIITTQVNFSSVQEWIQTKKQIESLSMVSNVNVKSMSPRAAILNVKFQGGEEGLRQALSQQGLVLNNAPQGQIYQIMRGVSDRAPMDNIYAPQNRVAPDAGYSANF